MTQPDFSQLTDRATAHLQALLRCDTQSPPGNEILAATYIRDVLAAEGIDAEFVTAAEGRVSVIARLSATEPTGRPVMMMGHIDVVTVDRDQWERDPFSGDLVDGFIWGRGAVDMKGQVAAELAAFIALKQQNVPLSRDVIFCAFADEESGGEFGADYVWKHARHLIDAEFAINEGGGSPMDVGGKRFYGCQVGEKGNAGLRVIVRGEPGHASVPREQTAMAKLPEVMRRLEAWEPELRITRSVEHMLRGIAEALGGETAELIGRILSADEPLWDDLAQVPLPESERASFWACTHNTAVPTMIAGGHRLNVIPSEITIDLDGRLLAGEEPEAFRASITAALGDIAELAWIYPEQTSGIEADPASPFFDAIRETMASLMPEATVIPTMIAGGTDAGLVPGVKVYGFFPMLPTERVPLYDSLVHGHNERLHVDDLAFGARFLYELMVGFCRAS